MTSTPDDLVRRAQQGYEIHGKKAERLRERAFYEGLIIGAFGPVIIYWLLEWL